MDLIEISKEIHEDNVRNGFWEDGKDRNKGEILMLAVSELAEAMEADRNNMYAEKHDIESCERVLKGNGVGISKEESFDEIFKRTVKNTFGDELADAVIRILDLAYGFDIDIKKHIELKLAYNRLRGYKHGGKKY